MGVRMFKPKIPVNAFPMLVVPLRTINHLRVYDRSLAQFPGARTNRKFFLDHPDRHSFIRIQQENEFEATTSDWQSGFPATLEAQQAIAHWNRRGDLWVYVTGNAVVSTAIPVYRGTAFFNTRGVGYAKAASDSSDEAVLDLLAEIQLRGGEPEPGYLQSWMIDWDSVKEPVQQQLRDQWKAHIEQLRSKAVN